MSAIARAARIDAHHHLWRLARGDYGWLAAAPAAFDALRRDFEPSDLAPLLTRHGVARTVLVQSAPTAAETDHLLELARRADWVAGVVGWVDLSRPGSAARLEQLALEPVFKGVRPMLQDLPDPDWICTAPDSRVVHTLERLGLCMDALVQPAHLPALARFARRFPRLAIVVDHAAKPAIGPGGLDAAWRRDMAALAALPQVCCKVSGLLGCIEPAAVRDARGLAQALQPCWDFLLGAFGPRRLLWGSDWPVLNLVSDYGQWVTVSELLLECLPTDEAAWVWAANAERFYRLGQARA